MQEQTKRLLRSDTVRRFLCWLIHLSIRLAYATSRLPVEGARIVRESDARGWGWVLKTWDRFNLPLPWSRGIYLWGGAIVVPPDLDDAEIENWRWRMEEGMIAQTAEADRRVGREAITPGTLERDALRAMRRTARGETP